MRAQSLNFALGVFELAGDALEQPILVDLVKQLLVANVVAELSVVDFDIAVFSKLAKADVVSDLIIVDGACELIVVDATSELLVVDIDIFSDLAKVNLLNKLVHKFFTVDVLDDGVSKVFS